MNVSFTAATDFVGMVVAKELLGYGQQVLELACSEESVYKLTATGADAQRCYLNYFESLKLEAVIADAVIHLSLVQDFGKIAGIDQSISN